MKFISHTNVGLLTMYVAFFIRDWIRHGLTTLVFQLRQTDIALEQLSNRFVSTHNIWKPRYSLLNRQVGSLDTDANLEKTWTRLGSPSRGAADPVRKHLVRPDYAAITRERKTANCCNADFIITTCIALNEMYAHSHIR